MPRLSQLVRLAPSFGVLLALSLEASAQVGTVQSEQKISETAGGFGGVLDPSDQFGRSVAALGDLDGDGNGDLAVGADLDDDGGTNQGAVWILFLNADGTVASEQKISETAGGFGGVLDIVDQFGFSVAALGDLDGDGNGDLAVGAVGDDDGITDQGAVWILFLNADGTVASEQKISETAGGFGGVLGSRDFFGWSVAALGDLDGDGNGDLAVGAVGDDDGGLSQGAVWILFLNADGTVASEQKISETAGGFGGVLDPIDQFGSSVTALGDLDGDGNGDLAVGAPLDDDGGTDQGAVWILFLNADGTVASEQKISGTAGGFGGVLDPNNYFGITVATLGDLDGDANEDLAVGAVLDDDGGTDQGAVWILFLNADGTVASEQKISETAGGFCGVLDTLDVFGSSVAALGDLDGDGIGDLAVGAERDDDGGSDQGAVWILFLEGAPPPVLTGPAWTAEGNSGSARFGSDVASAGDVNGDGYSDAVVTTGYGRAYVYLGSSTGLAPTSSFTTMINQGFGVDAASAGDINGDGYEDVLFGATINANFDWSPLGPVLGIPGIYFGFVSVYRGSPTGVSTTSVWTKRGTISVLERFGCSVASAGDVNADGYGDIVIGSTLLTYENGEALVYRGSSNGLSANPAWRTGIVGSQDGAAFGASVSSAGDVNGDGYDDVVVGAPRYDNGETDEGRAFLYLGSAGAMSLVPAWTAESNQANAQFGYCVAGAGDVNGDGYDDVVIGSVYYDNGQTNEGRAYLYLGSAGGLSTVPEWTAESDQAEAFFGRRVATAGDVNDDGYGDVIITAPRYNSVGRAFLYLGSACGLASAPSWTADGTQINAGFGGSAASAGDANGDGLSDVIIGASGFDNGHTDEGAAFLYLGSD